MKPLDKLKLEQAKAKAEMKIHEQRITDKLQHLEKNFGKMTVRSVLPLSSQQLDTVTKVLQPVNTLIDKIIPDSVSEEKKDQFKGILKTIQMVAAGLVFRYLKGPGLK